ncbi:sensor histidine kinase [Blastococcus montanus]|uniref:sensor histidine kinase n=1 Tax=Blastococcus montanus TaxID=3144973 RepID=UPI003209D0DB
MRRTMTLGAQLLLLQVGIVLVTLLLAGAVAVHYQQERIRDAYRQQVLTVANSTARLPSVVDAYGTPDPSETLQPLAELIREASAVTFVVITDRSGIRFSHPDPGRVGERVSTDPSSTLAGEVFVGTETGTLGESLRAKVPVRAPDGEVIGAVSVGILESQLAAEFGREAPVLVAWLGGAAMVGALGSVLVVRLLRRRIFGLEPEEIARLLETREAMLHGIREGLVAVDEKGRVVLVNDEASRLLDLPADVAGRPAADVLDSAMLPLVLGHRRVTDELVLSGERLLVANRTPAVVGGRRIAEVLTLRDRTELFDAMRELDGQRNLTNTLRAQAHEFSNQLHVVQGLIELDRPDDAVAFIERLGGGRLLGGAPLTVVADPGVSALLLAKAAVAREQGVRLVLDSGSRLPAELGDDVVTVLGNLVDNAIDATGSGGEVHVLVRQEDDGTVLVQVDDDGPGVAPAERSRVFDVGVTSKGRPDGNHGRGIGLALVARIATRRNGTATVTDSPAGGARVVVRLPRAAEAAPGALVAP